MGQRPKAPTPVEQAKARAEYERAVQTGTKYPLPDLGWIRPHDGDWRSVAGQPYGLVPPESPPRERKALGVGFDPIEHARRTQHTQ